MTNKRDLVLTILGLIAFMIVLSGIIRKCTHDTSTCTYNFPSYNPVYSPPAGTDPNQIFILSQDYPASFAPETNVWSTLDFHTDPNGYARAVLNYCLQGNTEIDFKVQNNSIRKWYHVPWLHYGSYGREWHHGLTHERSSRPRELGPLQTSYANTWAVGFYNAPGGYTIGRVWPDCGNNNPVPANCNFPEGTVTFKLLFTTATVSQVPYLQNTLLWKANIATFDGPRIDQDVRLLQIDIAVKDSDSPIGWVFGTFVYDGFAAGTNLWEHLKLVGISWGNDPLVTSHYNDDEILLNPDLNETWINSQLIPPDRHVSENVTRVYHLGLGGRLSGPVDNKISSCVSCHGKASVLKDLAPDPIERIGRMPRMVPRDQNNDALIMPSQMNLLKFNDFFGTNIASGSGDIQYNCFISGFDNNCNSPTPFYTFIQTDYSLQVATGIENYYNSIVRRAEDYIQQNMTPKRDP